MRNENYFLEETHRRDATGELKKWKRKVGEIAKERKPGEGGWIRMALGTMQKKKRQEKRLRRLNKNKEEGENKKKDNRKAIFVGSNNLFLNFILKYKLNMQMQISLIIGNLYSA